VETVIQEKQRHNDDRHPRWDRTRRAALFDQYRDLHAQSLSLRQATKALDVPRSTLQAWRAYAHHLGAHHSPDVFHVQHELVKAVSGPMATKQRAAAKTATEAQERLEQGQGQLQGAGDAPQKRGPGRPPKAAASLEQLEQEAQAASLEHQRLSAQ
jgi:hypothetical protein